MPEAPARPLVLAHGPASSDVSLQQLSLAASGNAPAGEKADAAGTRLSRFQLLSSVPTGLSAPAPGLLPPVRLKLPLAEIFSAELAAAIVSSCDCAVKCIGLKYRMLSCLQLDVMPQCAILVCIRN